MIKENKFGKYVEVFPVYMIHSNLGSYTLGDTPDQVQNPIGRVMCSCSTLEEAKLECIRLAETLSKLSKMRFAVGPMIPHWIERTA